MSLCNYKTNENSMKCESCKFNFVHNYKFDKNGYAHYLNLDNKIQQSIMWATCKMCPNRKDFEKMYGVEPVKYYSAALQ